MPDLLLLAHSIAANLMYIILAGLAVATVLILMKVQRTPDHFDLRSVIADDKGNPSVHKIGQLTALILSTWLLIYLTVHGQINEGYFGTYMGVWAAAQAADKLISRIDSGPNPAAPPQLPPP